MNRTEYFSETVCRKAMIFAIVSACFGAVSQIVFRESSIIILYASKLGAGRFLALFSTSIQLLSICVFIIPVSYLMEHTGIKKLVLPAIFMTLVGVLIVAAAGFFNKGAQALPITGLSIFAVSFFRPDENELAGSGNGFSGLFSIFHWKERFGKDFADSDCRYGFPDPWKIVVRKCPGILSKP